jgi:HlyD family secretion protein
MPSALDTMDIGAFSGMDNAGQNANEIIAFVIAPADTMQLIVNIDERDILAVEVGQQAEISLDAIEGEHFIGKISRINTTGTAVGGGARYAVEITVPRKSGMLPGMSASATTVTDEVSDILLIPSDAIQENGIQIYVFTSVVDGEPAAPISIQTGLSDGVYVEILEGLNLGDIVYYIIEESFNWQGFGMPFGPGGGAGGRFGVGGGN